MTGIDSVDCWEPGRMKSYLPLSRWLCTLALGVLGLILSGCLAMVADVRQTTSASAIRGAPAPDFALRDLSGKEVSLSGLRGKPVLLNFWATW